MDDSTLIVTIHDVHAAGMCSRGAREWFKRYGLDYSAFLRGEITADQLLATGNALAQRVVEVARARRR